ncbi:MAG: hypothetical protein NTV54_11905 [Ignavibacteriales bacterium]|nr:hypothetical protein [Ignavibacteriales bacterium]
MKKIVGSLLLLAVVITIVFPVVAFASSSAPMTANEMKAVVGGKDLAACGTVAAVAREFCREVGGGYFTCLATELFFLFGCIFS